MTNYQSPTPSSGSGSGCGKIFGWGCVGIIGFTWMGASMLFGGGSSIMFFVIIGVVIWLIVRSTRKNRANDANSNVYRVEATINEKAATQNHYDSLNTALPQTTSQPVSQAGDSAASGGEYENPVCKHTFTAAQISSGGRLTCGCGHSFSTADLKEYRRLSETLVKTYQSLEAVEERIKTSLNVTTSSVAAAATSMAAPLSAPAAAAPVAPVAPPKPVKPKVEKPKTNLSLAQWLIIGASILVMVAGSVFVATNRDVLSQDTFLAITVGLAIATGFGAFKTRSFSILLANFLAAFSSAMQLATMSIVADKIVPAMTWDGMDATWWTISLLVVSLAAGVLARFSKNFGFKGIAILGLAAAALVFDLGVLQPIIPVEAAPYHLAVELLAAVGVLAASKFLRDIAMAEVKDKAMAAYAKDLHEREGKTLSLASRGAAGLLMIAGLGVSMLGVWPLLTGTINVLSLVVFGASWTALGFTKKFWISELSSDKKQLAKLDALATNISYFSFILAAATQLQALAWTTNELGALTIGGATVLVMVASIYLAKLAKSFAPSARIQQIGLLILVLWSFTHSPIVAIILNTADGIAAAMTMLVLQGVALTFADWHFKNRFLQWPALVVSSIAAIGGVQVVLEQQSIPAMVGLMLLAYLPLVTRNWVNKRQNATPSVALDWAAVVVAGVITLISVSLVATQGAASPVVPLVLTLAGYATASHALAVVGPLKKNHSLLLNANGYLGQVGALLAIILPGGAQEPSAIALELLLLAVINYAFGAVSKQTIKMQLGFAAALVSFFVQQWSVDGQSVVAMIATQVSLVAAASWLHAFLLRKRSSAGVKIVSYTPVLAVATGLLCGIIAQPATWSEASATDHMIAASILGVLGVVAVFVSELTRTAKVTTRVQALRSTALVYSGWGVIVSLAAAFTESADSLDARWMAIVSMLFLSLVTLRLNAKRANLGLLITGFLSNLVIGWSAAFLTQHMLGTGSAPEPYTLWISAALIASTLFGGPAIKHIRRWLLIDVPVLVTALGSIAFALAFYSDAYAGNLRLILGWAVIAALAFVRSKALIPTIWLAVGYVASLLSAVSLSGALSTWFDLADVHSEVIALALAAAILVSNRVLVRRIGDKLADLRYSLLVAVIAIPEYYLAAFSSELTSPASPARRIGALVLVTALTYWRINRSKPLPWSIAAYVSSLASALEIGNYLRWNLLPTFTGPELNSLLVAGSVLLTHRFALKRFELKSTLLSWGLPIAVALVPSALFTYTALGTDFADLDAMQIARVVVVVLASIVLLVWGMRRGNLAMATMGVVGLGLMIVPNTAVRGGEVSVETTSLVIGALLFTLLAMFKAAGKLKGNSMLFIGLPITLFLAPSLVRSLMALGNAELTSVDWWRLAIVLTAGMTLLVVGALRELAGMFYPGLVSVLLSALPYGFKQNSSGEWFLWVLLLLVAGVMVWIAMRLEKMRKLGRGSSEWFRELK